MEEDLVLDESILDVTPGDYILTSNFKGQYSPEGVESLLHIPEGLDVSQPIPLIVYYHGTTSDFYAYQSIDSLKSWAQQDHFMVLSVQNLWGLDWENRDTATAIYESTLGAYNILTTLIKYGVVNPNIVFSTGFSGGGLVALCGGLASPELFAGVGDFKGNFYEDVVPLFEDEFVIKEVAYPGLLGKSVPTDLNVYLSMGGENEADRVKTQAPQANDYLETKGIPHTFFEYPAEGHSLEKTNFDDFWDTVVAPVLSSDQWDRDDIFDKDANRSVYVDSILE
ncbi:MAG: hypothetical protein ACD_28C00204G0006 [uncultured bacterium]|nr:MAG: hypothetical protein ACD_28C00204G0006 [uncultured bacterium]KKT74983.1 MAG: hypothetical protein UW70_C0041G0006 [Candidatus Peregrinibacteria bacterium GW2011_GWA2_44_7]